MKPAGGHGCVLVLWLVHHWWYRVQLNMGLSDQVNHERGPEGLT